VRVAAAAAAAQREKIAKSIGNYFSFECAVRNARYRNNSRAPLPSSSNKNPPGNKQNKKREKIHKRYISLISMQE
jgi:hypothetical protein